MTNLADEGHFFEVKLDLFDGPIDLLLHLVKQNELPIEKVSLALVANQYLECVEAFKHFDLELAGEYLVVAATLLSIKSSILLNEPVELVLDEDGNLVDPHEELLRKLRAAEVFKESVEKLCARDILGVDVFSSAGSLSQLGPGIVRLKQHDPMMLGKALRKLLLQAKGEDALYTVSLERVSIVERMMQILKLLEGGAKQVSFDKLIPDLNSRASIIASFIAILELCKRAVVSISQNETFDIIYVSLASGDYNAAGLSSEFDVQSEDEEKSLTANG
ncbi:MAG: segregation/condensation protein A [Deltaproteobacteria bacterium]|nr:segregation/condensation protein A [Deltaproteobacteria bacterium]